MTNKYVYKVVAVSADEKYASFIYLHRLYAECIWYKIGEWVEPFIEDSCIFAFESLHAAEKWTKSAVPCRSTVQILKCKYRLFDKPVITIAPVGSAWYPKMTIRQYWANRDNEDWHRSIPEGTVFCAKVKPIKVC